MLLILVANLYMAFWYNWDDQPLLRAGTISPVKQSYIESTQPLITAFCL